MSKFCPDCGGPKVVESKFCPQCGAGNGIMPVTPFVAQQVMFMPGDSPDEMLLMRDLTQNQQLYFRSEMAKIKKDPNTAFWWTFWLGSVGGQHFYLGNTNRGVLSLLFFWTTVPAILSFFELFSIKGKVRQMNNQSATKMATWAKTLPA